MLSFALNTVGFSFGHLIVCTLHELHNINIRKQSYSFSDVNSIFNCKNVWYNNHDDKKQDQLAESHCSWNSAILIKDISDTFHT